MRGKNHALVRFTIILGILFFLAATASSNEAVEETDNAPGIEDVKEKMGAAAESIMEYTEAQREQAAAKAREELNELDHRIAVLEKNMDQRWDQLSTKTREQWQNTLTQLRKKRIEAAEWYGGMKRGSADAWEEIKKGYANAYSDLEQSWKKAWKEFSGNNGTNETGQQK